jgi:4-hydroxymandelate oxidase
MTAMKPKLQTLPPDLLSLADYARLAVEFIAPPVEAWLEGGSGTGQALRGNQAAFSDHSIYNRVLVDMTRGSTATHLLGLDLHHPILLAPVGFHHLVHPQGEIATVRGALDTLMVVSTMASVPMEDIARAAPSPLWFQLYFQPDRKDTLRLVRRAEAAGYRAIVVTLDTPVQPTSLAAQKADFVIPNGIEAVHLRDNAPPAPLHVRDEQSLIFQGMMRHAPRRDDLEWLRGVTPLPIVAKGVSHPDDARALLAMGVDGIALSNHGGRALDCAPAPLIVLPAIRDAVGPEPAILIDGGVRTGSDVFKAIALGANAVMIGRPQMHALAVAGSLGIAHILKLLRDELELTMALAGTPTIADIAPGALAPAPSSFGDRSC